MLIYSNSIKQIPAFAGMTFKTGSLSIKQFIIPYYLRGMDTVTLPVATSSLDA